MGERHSTKRAQSDRAICTRLTLSHGNLQQIMLSRADLQCGWLEGWKDGGQDGGKIYFPGNYWFVMCYWQNRFCFCSFLSHYRYQAGLIWLNGKFYFFFFWTFHEISKRFLLSFVLSSSSPNTLTQSPPHTHTPNVAVSNLFCFFFFLSLFFLSCDLTHTRTQGPEAWTLLSVWLTQQVTKRFYTRLKQSV